MTHAFSLFSTLDSKTIGMIVMILSAGILLRLTLGKQRKSAAPAPIAKRFLTDRESAMLPILEELLPHCRLHAQVSMGALLDVPAQPGRAGNPARRNAFSQKIVDFVAQDRRTGLIIALIEVDDRTHNAARDRSRDAMTAGAGYRTLRIPARAKQEIDVVRPIVESIMGEALPGCEITSKVDQYEEKREEVFGEVSRKAKRGRRGKPQLTVVS